MPGKIKARGGEALVQAAFVDALTTKLSYTYNRSHNEAGEQIARVPEQLIKATVDYHPESLLFGATLAINYTGDVFAPVRGERVQYGDPAVVDVSGRYFLDTDHKHRLVLSLQNVFDKEYGRPSNGCLDVAGAGPRDCSAPYTYVNLGLPRTLRASYTHAF